MTKLNILILSLVLLVSKLVYASFEIDNADFVSLLKNTPISVVAPASGVDDAQLRALQNISSLKLLFIDNCFDGSKSLFHSNSDQARFECLKNALFDESSSVIWCLRGGYGSAKLISQLKQLDKPQKEKWFVGFSDITALHIFLTQEWKWKTIHGNGIAEILNPDKQRTNFTKIAEIISNTASNSTISGLIAMNSEARQNHQLHGTLTGGNLTVIETSIGTDWEIKTADKILFLEDVGIKPYQLDRALYHLKQAELLVKVKAIIFGSCGNDDQDIIRVIKDFAAITNIPLFKTNRFGHEQINDPIIYNTSSMIIAVTDGKFNLIMKR